MKRHLCLVFFLALCSAARIVGHEGHEIPGALPPPPHGGRVEEVADVVPHRAAAGKIESGDHEEPELYFEALYRDKKIHLYPLARTAKEPSRFRELATSSLEGVRAKIEFPRAKRFETVKLTPVPGGYEAAFDAKKARRFIVHVDFQHETEAKTVKIQIETLE